jgi:hypothetical protein
MAPIDPESLADPPDTVAGGPGMTQPASPQTKALAGLAETARKARSDAAPKRRRRVGAEQRERR